MTPLDLWKFLRRIPLIGWIILWTIAGVLLGFYAKEFSKNYMGLLSTHLFLPLVKSIIVPLVFSTLVVGIAGHSDDLKRLGRMTVKALVLFMVLSLVAIFIGLGFANLIQPGKGIDIYAFSSNVTAVEKQEITLAHELEKIVPHSFFQAAAETNTLQIVVCACFFSVGILTTKNQRAKQSMIDFNYSLSHVMFKVTEIIMKLVPLAIAGAVAHTIASNGAQVFLNLGKLVGCVYLGLVAFMAFLALLALAFRIPIFKFAKTIWEPLTIAFATASSDAALPLAMEKMIEFGVPEGTVGFIIPLGYTFNLAGTTLYLGAASMFAAQSAGLELPIGTQIVMMLSFMLMSKGVAGVPRASLVILASGSAQFGLPVEAVPIILTIDEIMDMARTAVNLVGNCLSAVIICKWEREFTLTDIERGIESDRASSKTHEISKEQSFSKDT